VSDHDAIVVGGGAPGEHCAAAPSDTIQPSQPLGNLRYGNDGAGVKIADMPQPTGPMDA
jgi:hypothetical protein